MVMAGRHLPRSRRIAGYGCAIGHAADDADHQREDHQQRKPGVRSRHPDSSYQSTLPERPDNIGIAMPIYEYSCESCGNKFEKLVRRTEDAMESGCPSCGKKHLQQEYSTFAARANSSPGASEMPSCGGGMCMTPGMCGRNQPSPPR